MMWARLVEKYGNDKGVIFDLIIFIAKRNVENAQETQKLFTDSYKATGRLGFLD